MAAGATEPNPDLVAGGGDRSDPGPDLADVELGVAVQREDPVDRGDPAGREHVESATGHLLGWLEDQPYLAGQRPGRGRASQEQASSEQDRGMHVVPARLAGP